MPAEPPIRRRLHRREEPDRIRFVTFSCHRRLPLLTNPGICRVFLDRLEATRVGHGVEVIAWVIMPEHVHLLIRPAPNVLLSRTLRSLKMSVAKRVLARWRELRAPILNTITSRTGPCFWQKGGGFDRNVRDDEELSREIRYIHQNPVERGLVAKPDEWQWSSVHWWLGRRESEFPCTYPRGTGWASWTGFISRR